MLNDPQFLKAARGLGKRMMDEGGSSVKKRLQLGFRLATARQPERSELKVLMSAYERELKRFESKPEEMNDFLGSLADEDRSPELAASSMVASIILNLSETLTRQ